MDKTQNENDQAIKHKYLYCKLKMPAKINLLLRLRIAKQTEHGSYFFFFSLCLSSKSLSSRWLPHYILRFQIELYVELGLEFWLWWIAYALWWFASTVAPTKTKSIRNGHRWHSVALFGCFIGFDFLWAAVLRHSIALLLDYYIICKRNIFVAKFLGMWKR